MTRKARLLRTLRNSAVPVETADLCAVVAPGCSRGLVWGLLRELEAGGIVERDHTPPRHGGRGYTRRVARWRLTTRTTEADT